MTKQKRTELLLNLSKTAYGSALRDYLEEKTDEIKDISNVDSWEETIGKRTALTVLKDLFKFLEEKPLKKEKDKNEYL